MLTILLQQAQEQQEQVGFDSDFLLSVAAIAATIIVGGASALFAGLAWRNSRRSLSIQQKEANKSPKLNLTLDLTKIEAHGVSGVGVLRTVIENRGIGAASHTQGWLRVEGDKLGPPDPSWSIAQPEVTGVTSNSGSLFSYGGQLLEDERQIEIYNNDVLLGEAKQVFEVPVSILSNGSVKIRYKCSCAEGEHAEGEMNISIDDAAVQDVRKDHTGNQV